MCRDAEVRYSAIGNNAVAKFSLAVDRRFKREGDEQTADFINCTAFGKTAEFLEKYGLKGTKFIVEGRIQTGNYTNKDGQKVYTTDVVVESIEFAESKSSNDNHASQGRPTPSNGDGFMQLPDINDEELPFT